MQLLCWLRSADASEMSCVYPLCDLSTPGLAPAVPCKGRQSANHVDLLPSLAICLGMLCEHAPCLIIAHSLPVLTLCAQKC